MVSEDVPTHVLSEKSNINYELVLINVDLDTGEEIQNYLERKKSLPRYIDDSFNIHLVDVAIIVFICIVV